MATLVATTVSNSPTLKKDSVDEIEDIIDQFEFWGTHSQIEVTTENFDDALRLVIRGGADFVVSEKAEDVTETAPTPEAAQKFLSELAPHLEEKLVIQSVGTTKCRFPALAKQWTVDPDGSVSRESFDW